MRLNDPSSICGPESRLIMIGNMFIIGLIKFYNYYLTYYLTMTDPIGLIAEETAYFDTEYRPATIITGLLMYPMMASIGWPMYFLDRVAQNVKNHKDLMATWNSFT